MTDQVKPSAAALKEALGLSEQLLRGIELSQVSLTNAALMSTRLARLLNDFHYQKIFEYEVGGYPASSAGVTPDVWKCAQNAGRVFEKKGRDGQVGTYAVIESIEQLEAQVESAKLGLDAARDAGISVSSANPNQYVSTAGNALERQRLHNELKELVKKLGSRRSFLYSFVLQKNLELKFSNIAGDAFSTIRERVDKHIGAVIPNTSTKLIAIYENLQSDSPEDWSNAVHGCRRVLQELADVLFPATNPRQITRGAKPVTINLGADNYINRLVCFAEDNSSSACYCAVVGSQLSFLGDRLDALFSAAQKGSHSVISTRDEADRYVVYTYMVVGDLLHLRISTNAQAVEARTGVMAEN